MTRYVTSWGVTVLGCCNTLADPIRVSTPGCNNYDVGRPMPAVIRNTHRMHLQSCNTFVLWWFRRVLPLYLHPFVIYEIKVSFNKLKINRILW